MHSIHSRIIRIYGIVQGVGFRPFVSRAAVRLGLTGSVANKGSYVEIHAQGTPEMLSQFRRILEQEAPPRSAILKIDVHETDESPAPSFEIIESEHETGDIFVSPDIATCDDCRRELFDPADRRYLHPFINCTACGPRLTILDAMPYDRERTSMGVFPMCPQCEYEYTHPETRRYDAQPVCCNDCGPEVYLIGRPERGADAITLVRRMLMEGKIAAVKGIGGFHLCCNARNPEAVRRLRQLKKRPAKPFALMMRDLSAVEKECEVPVAFREILTEHQKPIVLLRKRTESTLCEELAPGNPTLGVMLPYAPVQMLLFDYPDGIDMTDVLVMTSGNVSGAPICRTDADALAEISGFCDVMLSHNRRIRLRADDSVMDVFEEKPYMIRRSRGYAPLPFSVSGNFKGQVLGVGGELKNTFCPGKDGWFYPSPYVGDMADLRTLEALRESVKRLNSLLEIRPVLAACDLHPKYNTTAFAEELGLPLLKVQHHYAHILSCMAENDCTEPVIGVSFDGTGYGTDGTVWGGEILSADLSGFEREGAIQPFLQPGGDISAREGWRIAGSMLHSLDREHAPALVRELQLCTDAEFRILSVMTERMLNCVRSTSAGRLFDAVSAILGIRRFSTFEGEASMALQFAAENWREKHPQPEISPETNPLRQEREDFFTLATGELVRGIVKKRLSGIDTGLLAYEFHVRLAEMIAVACRKVRDRRKRNICALSGGVFQNRLLTELCVKQLRADGFRVLLHSMVPPNDGGIALGQALAATAKLNHIS